MFARVSSLFLLLLLSGLVLAGAQVDTDANGVALKGHDAVAYHTMGKAVAGSADFTAEHNGASYQFANAENRDMFKANPAKYAPKYGGYCAFGTTFSKKVPGDPQAFKVVDGKLYINSSSEIQTRWEGDIAGNIDKANMTWSEIKDKDPADL